MKRLVQTTAGDAVLDVEYERTPGGMSVAVTPFDGDGWEGKSKMWVERWGHHRRGEPLVDFLATALQVPADEATTLAESIRGPWLAEWNRRGGAEEARALQHLSVWVMSGLAVVALLALLGVVLAVRLLAA